MQVADSTSHSSATLNGHSKTTPLAPKTPITPHTRPTGSYYGHDREQVTRIIIQSLTDLGYHAAATTLTEESAYELETHSVALFRDAVLDGDWSRSEQILCGKNALAGIPLTEGVDRHDLLFLIRRQKFLETLEQRDQAQALAILRRELTPLQQGVDKLHSLSRLIMCKSVDDLRSNARWDGANGDSRLNLLSDLSRSIAASVMIPERRLAVLLDQLQTSRIDKCPYHNTLTPPSLYEEHQCEQEDFPTHCLMELDEAIDEIWHMAFSPAGDMLAAAGRDNALTIYETAQWRLIHRLRHPDHIVGGQGLCFLSWSPNGRHLIACSKGYNLAIYDMENNGAIVQSIDDSEASVSSAHWISNTSFVMTTQDSSRSVRMYHLGATRPVKTLSSDRLRINDCSVSPRGDRLALVTTDTNRVLVYDLTTWRKISEWRMQDRLVSVDYSQNDRDMLVTMQNNGMLLLDAVTGSVLTRYSGTTHRKRVIRGTFGGAGENFVVSGSESDSKICIWSRRSGAPIATLAGHTGGTNIVAWHPTRPHVLASAGDDCRIKIFSNRQALSQRQQSLSTKYDDMN